MPEDRRVMPSNVYRMPEPGYSPPPQPPDGPAHAHGVRPCGRMLMAKSGLVVRQLIDTRDARRVARRHGVTVREIVGVLIDHVSELKRAA